MIENERCCVPRFPFHSRALVVFPATYRDVTLLDISANGAFVEAIDAGGLFVGTRCTLMVPGVADRQALQVNTIVMHHMDGRRFGLGLRNLSTAAENSLRRMIEMNLGTEALLRRELRELLKPIGAMRRHSGLSASLLPTPTPYGTTMRMSRVG